MPTEDRVAELERQVATLQVAERSIATQITNLANAVTDNDNDLLQLDNQLIALTNRVTALENATSQLLASPNGLNRISVTDSGISISVQTEDRNTHTVFNATAGRGFDGINTLVDGLPDNLPNFDSADSRATPKAYVDVLGERISALEGTTAQTGNTSSGAILNAPNETEAFVETTQNNSAIKVFNGTTNEIYCTSTIGGETIYTNITRGDTATWRHSAQGNTEINVRYNIDILPTEGQHVILESAGG